MAEAVVDHHGKGQFRAYSAAVDPAPEPDPLTLQVLAQGGYRTDGLRAKHWREFTRPDAPVLDFVFTLSDTETRDAFPEWPGKPASSHWRYPDPTKATGEDWQRRREFARTLSSLERQMRIFMQLSFASLDRMALQKRLDDIGAEQSTSETAR